jgi:sulfide:quinone oxidoreductase
VIEPRETHEYKPLFSHVAGGTAPASITVRPQAEVIPSHVEWMQDAVSSVDPESSTLKLASGGRVAYEQLVVCPGIQYDWAAVPGLVDALATPAVTSHYERDLAQKTSRLLRDLRGGTVVFVQPPGPASCSGAAQKPMYQACDYWRATGVLDAIRVVMVVPTDTIFGIPHIDRELDRKVAEYGIELRTSTTLATVAPDVGEIVLSTPDGGERLAYDVLNVVPPQSAPDWLSSSNLADPADADGFIEVDPHTLRHPRFPNVWALGDAAATRNSKCGGALRKQTFAVAKNLAATLAGEDPTARYDQYGVCPLTVSRSTVVWAEFDDGGRAMPTIPFWKSMYRESRLSWIFDRHILPWVYWNLILTGRV